MKTSILMMVLCLTVTSGCGDGGAAVLKRRSDLNRVGLAYHGFYQDNQRGPADARELTTYMASKGADDPATSDAITSLAEGDIVLIYDGVLGDGDENARYVLGFEARAASGGYVVMGDGLVELMTGKEFSEATMLPQRSGRVEVAEPVTATDESEAIGETEATKEASDTSPRKQ